jgi:hypothetical protein
MARYSTDDQILEIMSTSLYQSGATWSSAEMLKQVTTTKHSSRLLDVLREMHRRGLIKGGALSKRNDTYQRAGHTWLRKRWISEVAEDLCSGDTIPAIAGQAARDAFRRARAPEGAGKKTCGDSV